MRNSRIPRFYATLPGKIVIGALAGGLSGGIATGSLRGVALGALTEGAFAAIGSIASVAEVKGLSGWGPGRLKKVLAHGLVGGISNKMQGGNFFKGVLAGGLAQGFAPVLAKLADISKTVASVGAGVLGGVGSVITGGKFREGFWIGFYSHQLNNVLHEGIGGNDGLSKYSDALSAANKSGGGWSAAELTIGRIFKGVGTAIYRGFFGGTNAIENAGNATWGMATEGPLYVRATLAVGAVTTAPAWLAKGYYGYQFACYNPAVIAIAPYSREILDFTSGFFVETGPPQGYGYYSSGTTFIYDFLYDE